MSVQGQSRRFGCWPVTSSLPLKPDIVALMALVSVGPNADSGYARRSLHLRQCVG
jgi:hypothetical protein